MEVSGQLHATATLPRGKNPVYPLVRSRSGRCGEEKNLLLLPVIELGRSAFSRRYTDCALPIPRKLFERCIDLYVERCSAMSRDVGMDVAVFSKERNGVGPSEVSAAISHIL
jgi:hypothetical protein